MRFASRKNSLKKYDVTKSTVVPTLTTYSLCLPAYRLINLNAIKTSHDRNKKFNNGQ